MFLIAGLGNPGRQYEKTRHNMGFDAIDELIERHRIPQGGIAHKAMYGKGIIEGEKVILAKPLTYMNLSGDSLREFVNYYKLDPESEMIVLYDDIDLDPGQIRIRKKGSAGEPAGVNYAGIYAAIGKFNRVPGDPVKTSQKPGRPSAVRLRGITESPYDVWAFSWYGKRCRQRGSELSDHCGE